MGVYETYTSADRRVVLQSLGDSWSPWRFQVTITVQDGAAYGRAGQVTTISQSNFIRLDEALKVYRQSL